MRLTFFISSLLLVALNAQAKRVDSSDIFNNNDQDQRLEYCHYIDYCVLAGDNNEIIQIKRKLQFAPDNKELQEELERLLVEQTLKGHGYERGDEA